MHFLFQGKYLTFREIQNYKQLNLFRFNYLNHFTTLLGEKKLTNDIGWSCTIKSFQMLLALILSKFYQSNEIIKMIYKDSGILSIHNFVNYLNKKKMKEGVYLGSFLISNIYSEIIQEYENQKSLNFNISFTHDNIIDINQLNLHQNNVLLFSVRLGLEKLNKKYYSLICNCFQSKFCLGFIGGIGESCYYFYAYDTKTDYLLYLDPHVVTNYNKDMKLKFLSAKTHSIAYIKDLNPSITFCFYYQDYETFMELKKFLEKYTIFNILHKNTNKLKNEKKHIKKTDVNDSNDDDDGWHFL